MIEGTRGGRRGEEGGGRLINIHRPACYDNTVALCNGSRFFSPSLFLDLVVVGSRSYRLRGLRVSFFPSLSPHLYVARIAVKRVVWRKRDLDDRCINRRVVYRE